MKQTVKKIIFGPVDWLTYTVLNERHRKAIGDLFSEEQKQLIRKLLTGKQQAERQKLKQMKAKLYNLGFTERAEKELEAYFQDAKDLHLKRLAAWELVLWHANQNTEAGAEKALKYIESAKDGEKDEQQQRRIAILEAECLDRIGKRQKAVGVIQELLQRQTHPDLHLAAANLEPAIDERLKRMNEVMAMYNLAPIAFSAQEREPEYDDLITETIERKITDGPKVSVILPAFKAEEGVRVAIESILSQTWQNIELLAVDDCSPDGTKAVLEQYAEKDDRVKVFQTPVNSGPYVARNIALQHATGEFVTINDADDWSHAEKIEKQVKHLIANEHVIANTSEHARLTEELTLYRRGTPGKYIFPNMSSIMFRRKPVMEKIGYWDSVRFAADGEFKRRLLQAFGKNSYVDLNTGPLSLPRQSVTSLTASSAFGYNGFFMGVRREYVEAMSHYHQNAKSLYYPYPMEARPYHVPEPMWPKREGKPDGKRHFDLIIATDFRILSEEKISFIRSLYEEGNIRIGLLELYKYDADARKALPAVLRELLDGDRMQRVVYGEKLVTDQLLIFQPAVLAETQRYVPEAEAKELAVVIDELPEGRRDFRKYMENLQNYFKQDGKWYAETAEIKERLLEQENGIPIEKTVWKKSWVNDGKRN